MLLSVFFGVLIMMYGFVQGLKVFAVVVVFGFVIKGFWQGFKKEFV